MGLQGAGGGWSPPGGVRGAKRTGRGELEGKAEGRRSRPQAGGGAGGRSKPGQGGEGVLARTLRRFAERTGGAGGRCRRTESIEIARSEETAAVDQFRKETAAGDLGRQNN